MRIGIDARLWNETGVGRYVRNLVSNLVLINSRNEYVLFIHPSIRKGMNLSNVKCQMSIVDADFPWHSISEQVNFPKVLNMENLDLVHFPYFSVPIFYKRPYIITLHDLIVKNYATGRASTLPYPLYLAKRLGYKAVLSNAVRKSKKIIVPSNAVRDEVLKAFPSINSDKVEVIYEGGFGSNIKNKKFNLPAGKAGIKNIEREYFVRVGNYYPHKNIENLLFAFKMLINDFETRHVKLVLVGKKDFFFKKIEKLVLSLDLKENIIFLEDVDDQELISLYQNSKGVVVPSFMEGFSLTSVEALSVGSIVIASDIPVHREVCEACAIYFNPNDPDEIRKRMEEVFKLTKESRSELIKEGLEQSKKFSWKKMAKETLGIYKSQLNQ
ncbi:MAG: hypothetical protein A3C27_02150 [Candidatus Levybacteria bacterium RIFCSPHIGHO2_02_FULL_39_36]|nr:MAG: Glycosyl transferase, group 1 [Candidatus Levybacteria bacterium GW2011_GWA1_39_11]KKR24867.1 MAG: Glycosyl transferase, group 1 [Candidatus Levybacteria bacterium GW2011_GWB1_39_7]KKR50108.1 MAG: Glycosyl transferase, group 1 [Candidatus Levybacteria bacterium GW2011_GWA2_40_16]OGH15560.1 MAG: hypothetical protein A2689_00870 [Candidatus Levybacteria bacterium RIFCSPHIGHO2_01_FULL_38_96]OGH25358.1 MAG: hypothetical protein A3E68_01340 [Candidatus Levybacteria bacterium RIFCSPHIGHO2_12_